VVICGETLALILLQKVIVSKELEACGRHRCDLRTRGIGRDEVFAPPELLEWTEVHHQTYRVRLECDERQRRPYRITKPESQRDRQFQRTDGEGVVGIDIPVPNHIVESIPLVGGNGQLCPDIEPFAGMFVDLLVSDFDADILDDGVPDIVRPVVLRTTHIRESREIDLQE